MRARWNLYPAVHQQRVVWNFANRAPLLDHEYRHRAVRHFHSKRADVFRNFWRHDDDRARVRGGCVVSGALGRQLYLARHELRATGAGSLRPSVSADYHCGVAAACEAAQKGLSYSVSDAATPSYNGAVVGGGSNVIPVFCNGSTWTAH